LLDPINKTHENCGTVTYLWSRQWWTQKTQWYNGI